MDKPSFGQIVKQLRKQSGIGQMDLADAIGVGFTYISKIENDKVMDAPSNAVLEGMARVFGMTTEYMFAVAGRIDTRALRDLAASNENAALLLNRLPNATEDQILWMLVLLDDANTPLKSKGD